VKAPKNNPPLFTEVFEYAVPGFAGFALTRFATRVATTQIGKRAPSWGKHAGAVASVGSVLAAWFLGNKWKLLERWHVPIVVGSFIAAAQSMLQLYAPNLLGWAVADASPEIAAPDSATQSLSAPDVQLAQLQLQPTNEDPSEFVYNDSYDAGRYGGRHGHSSMKTQPEAATANDAQEPIGDLAIDDAIGSANLGVFAN
jgi:hypothetical protein